MKDYRSLAADVQEYMVAMRRELHKRPCLTGDERETTEFIEQQMIEMGIPYHIDSLFNLVAKIEGNPGKRIALRADTDALPMKEDTGLSFSSEKEGVMHACGHDFHVANLLGVAKVLHETKSDLNGTVYLCFQMGEEQSMGALELLEYLEEQGGVDTCFGVHVNGGAHTGTIQMKRNELMAGCSLFTIEVKGRGGHGSTPWACVDPIKPACEILLQIAAAPASRFSAFDSVVISPCAIQSGSAGNIIPDKAYIEGNFRYFRDGLFEKIVETIDTITTSTAKAYGVEAILHLPPHNSPPMLIEDASYDRLEKVLTQQGINLEVVPEPWMGSDNFAEYLKKYGGIYCFGGVTKEGSIPYPVHNVKFNPDEAALAVFCEMFIAYTDEFLNESR